MPNYLYNGVELPDINEVWTDKEKYPYVVYCRESTQNIPYCFMSSAPFLVRVQLEGVLELAANGLISQCGFTDNTWTLAQSGELTEYGRIDGVDPLIWTNTDIFNEDGTLHLAASEPIPVGGEPEKPNTGFLYLTSMLLGWLVGRRIAGQRGEYVEPDVPDVPSGVYDDEWPIEWNTLAVLNNPTAAMGDLPFVKVSNLTPTQEEMQSMVLASTFGGGSLLELPYMDGGAFDLGYGATYGTAPAFLVVVVTTAGQSAELEVTFPETGIYVENYGVDGTDINLAIKEAPKTPIAYLYNGVQLPDINAVWTEYKSSFPYASITDKSSGITLFFTATRPYHNGYFLTVPSQGTCVKYNLIDSAWVFEYQSVIYAGSSMDTPIWASADILNTDGTTYLAASEPVPVYE